jgi:4-hydroxymandelate synthase
VLYGFAFAELCVNDRVAMTGYFTRGFELVRVAEALMHDRHSTLLRGRGIQLVITVPVGDSGPVSDWLTRHGEALVDLAMYHRQVALISSYAAFLGLPVLSPLQPTAAGHHVTTIGGVGSICHTLIDPGLATVPIAPPGRPWQWERSANVVSRHLTGIDHVEICVPTGTLASTVELYRRLFGLIDHSIECIRVFK